MRYTKNIIFLLLADVIWGAAFVAQRTGGDVVGAYSFNCIRSFIGCLVLIPIIIFMDGVKGKQEQDKPNRGKLWKGGIICGAALCFASNFQQVGITMGASVGKAGFLTACYILMVPILGIFLHKKCGWNVGIGVGLALVGLYLLCLKENSGGITTSDLLLLLCAFAFAIQILAVDHFAVDLDPVRLSCIQFLVCGSLSVIPMVWVDMGHSVSGAIRWAGNFTSIDAWIPILYAGVCSCGIAYTFQIMGQRNFNPTIASLIMSLESSFSVLFGWLFLHETLSMREAVGVGMIFLAILVAQLPIGRPKTED